MARTARIAFPLVLVAVVALCATVLLDTNHPAHPGPSIGLREDLRALHAEKTHRD